MNSDAALRDVTVDENMTPAPLADPSNTKPWAWTSSPLRALDLKFAIQVDDSRLGRYLDAVLASERSAGTPSTMFSVVGNLGSAQPRAHGWGISADGELRRSVARAGDVVPELLAEINAAVVRTSSDRHVMLHASGSARGDRGAIFPAPPESGKTTLAAGLLLAGLSYVTDEAIAIDTTSGLVRPFPKPLSIDPGSWEVLEALRPRLDADAAKWATEQWHVDAASVRPDAVSGVCRAAFIVAPRFERGAQTSLTPMHRADAVTYLMNNAFEGNRRERLTFEILSRVVRQASCYELVIGDLGHACDLVVELFETA